jgi:hypothetical protein
MIESHLRMNNFSHDQLQELKQYRLRILIYNGYGESQQAANLHTTNYLNRQDGW